MLAYAIHINIYQSNIEDKIENILKNVNSEVSKSDIRHEIRSNHKMTEKVLDELQKEGLVEIVELSKKTIIKITKKGVLHLAKWNRFYMELYREQLRDHYRYVGLPEWFREGDLI